MSLPVAKPLIKSHSCENCSRSFVTSRALRDHCLSVSHGFDCTARGCRKLFTSSAALAAHLSSSYHGRPVRVSSTASSTRVHVITAPTLTPSIQLQGSAQILPCTVTGCAKTFKTTQSRAQHLQMASHGRTPTPSATQTVVRTVAPVAERSGTVTSGSGQQTETERSNNALRAGDGAHVPAAAKPVVHNPNSAKRLKKSVSEPTAAGSSRSHTAKPSLCEPLFRWDTRWSAIPSPQHESTMSALKAAVPNPTSCGLTSVDKAFWTPDHKAPPSPDSASPKRKAIVLDCEMVGIGPKGTTSELARLSAVDFVTGELLIDTLVEPICPVTDMRTKWSGITAESMKAAVESGNALKGSTAARTELFTYMDSQTILVGHSLQYDLEALGISHSETVDSATLAEAAVGKGVKRRWGLKVLCKDWLNITVQDDVKHGHDSVEDALAAREVVLWCLEHKKELKSWGQRKKKEYYSECGRSKHKPQVTRRRKVPEIIYFDDDSDDLESEFRCLSVGELNELCHYPEWYDNWSD